MSDYRALYRKWRPTDFDDVVGQSAITDILKYEVSENRLSHAYLFCGSRGTGKTTCAKILAKAVNCLSPKGGNPCNECAACKAINAGTATDVIEMDAASNNGVDNVRDMKDEIAFTPAELKFRVYIIDEVHMMSPSAFNALLKTLEEPPTYVIFILATTELHKLPTTIVSRCQRFDFKRISGENIVGRLKEIAGSEGIDLTEDGARVIARVARGGMRDAISLLELCAGARQRIDAELVFSTVGSGNRDSTYGIIRAIIEKNYDKIYKTISEIVEKSGDVAVFWQELIDAYRDIMVVKNTDRAASYLDLTEGEYEELAAIARELSPARLAYHTTVLEGAMADMQRAYNSKRAIAEIALTRMCDAKSAITPEALALRLEELERALTSGRISVKEEEKPRPVSSSAPKEAGEPKVAKPTAASAPTPKASPAQPASEPSGATVTEPRPLAEWRRVLDRIGEIKRPLAVQFARSRCMVMPDGGYRIYMNAFFAKMLSGSESDMAIVRTTIAEALGKSADTVKITVEAIDASKLSPVTDDLFSRIDN
ncbi:MAG: DNA polymerase III subunit gamma/tau [Clostridia bacterium]|nr:DNA polymerase III subunit gamma/tau [Clostridia bacterium]